VPPCRLHPAAPDADQPAPRDGLQPRPAAGSVPVGGDRPVGRLDPEPLRPPGPAIPRLGRRRRAVEGPQPRPAAGRMVSPLRRPMLEWVFPVGITQVVHRKSDCRTVAACLPPPTVSLYPSSIVSSSFFFGFFMAWNFIKRCQPGISHPLCFGHTEGTSGACPCAGRVPSPKPRGGSPEALRAGSPKGCPLWIPPIGCFHGPQRLTADEPLALWWGGLRGPPRPPGLAVGAGGCMSLIHMVHCTRCRGAAYTVCIHQQIHSDAHFLFLRDAMPVPQGNLMLLWGISPASLCSVSLRFFLNILACEEGH